MIMGGLLRPLLQLTGMCCVLSIQMVYPSQCSPALALAATSLRARPLCDLLFPVLCLMLPWPSLARTPCAKGASVAGFLNTAAPLYDPLQYFTSSAWCSLRPVLAGSPAAWAGSLVFGSVPLQLLSVRACYLGPVWQAAPLHGLALWFVGPSSQRIRTSVGSARAPRATGTCTNGPREIPENSSKSGAGGALGEKKRTVAQPRLCFPLRQRQRLPTGCK